MRAFLSDFKRIETHSPPSYLARIRQVLRQSTAFYIKSGQGKYSTDNNTLKEYKNNPIEIAAFPVVRQAIEDQSIQLYTCSEPSGYGKYSPCPYPKWIKR
jgi:hypothetical protein